MNNTKIEWCDATVNPVIGCTFGCPYCYARKLNKRFGWTEDFSVPTFRHKQLYKLELKKPKTIFMNSMSDIADWDFAWAWETVVAMRENPQHRYLFLTKRPEAKGAQVLANTYPDAWIGVTVTKRGDLPKVSACSGLASNTFVSIEPIHEHLHLTGSPGALAGVSWVIIGAETGNRKNKVVPEKEWIDDIVSACRLRNIPVFMKDSLIPVVGEENVLREKPKALCI